MDPSNRGGIYDLLTALESCYEHIQKEEINQPTDCWEVQKTFSLLGANLGSISIGYRGCLNILNGSALWSPQRHRPVKEGEDYHGFRLSLRTLTG
ncbi:hypothetical protein XENTR_v10000927 [Xenopus tropicalis]|nr:hypothetical protein XENTR_v10000927 [Xenopus tropicalis]